MIRHMFLRFRGSESGATAVEYGLLLSLMVLAIIGGITALGSGTADNFDNAAGAFPEGSGSAE